MTIGKGAKQIYYRLQHLRDLLCIVRTQRRNSRSREFALFLRKVTNPLEYPHWGGSGALSPRLIFARWIAHATRADRSSEALCLLRARFLFFPT